MGDVGLVFALFWFVVTTSGCFYFLSANVKNGGDKAAGWVVICIIGGGVATFMAFLSTLTAGGAG